MRDVRWLRSVLIVAVLLGIAAWFFLRKEGPEPVPASSRPPSAATAPAKTSVAEAKVETPPLAGESRLADELNAPTGTIQRDLKILNEVFETWQTNFPRTWNPVGENSEITAALTGANEHRFAFIPPGHRAINARGELCDRWGTPFRLHQLSGQHMEIRSAGPDRKFLTDDDAVLSPEVALVR
jgi:hypothetical protein